MFDIIKSIYLCKVEYVCVNAFEQRFCNENQQVHKASANKTVIKVLFRNYAIKNHLIVIS